MHQRPLGRTGIEVSEISFGSVALGMPYGFTSDTPEHMLAPDEAVALLRTALDHGINFFDTAPGYGRSEELMAGAFADRRDQVVISTKSTRDTFDEQGRLLPADELRRCVRGALEESLHRLQTDHVDVFLVHRVTEEVLSRPDVVELYQGIKEEGLTRAVGVSTYGPEQTRRAITSGQWDVVQMAYNLMDQKNAAALPLAQEHGVGVMVRSVLLKGILVDNAPALHPALKAVEEHRRRYRELLGGETRSLESLAIKFVLAHREVSSVLVGIDRMGYLEQALRSAESAALSPEVVARARELAYPEPDFIDLPMWDRKGWLH